MTCRDDEEPEALRYQRGEVLRMTRVLRRSVDAGTTWERVDLSGLHYARDIRRWFGENEPVLLAIRDNDANHYARLQVDEVQLDGEDAPSSVGVIVVEVPWADVDDVLPEGRWATDEAIGTSPDDWQYLSRGLLTVLPRTTVIS